MNCIQVFLQRKNNFSHELLDDNEIVNEVWDVVGNNYEKKAIIEALDEVDWVSDDAINLLLTGIPEKVK